ncbi:hypothetical protein [Paenibacillus larvae]|uniref:Uncharacterized protein n=1 Tax=Paenibacillus larvae subsp. larvae TaxID=147375 RepID=A0A6C0QZ56_9BACL|nr:hypothetical protein [Paenibacillus larvae]QHZ54014.1 hypothetical protein ERICV_05030 [Paenibacillus larvae subsp. larvae]
MQLQLNKPYNFNIATGLIYVFGEKVENYFIVGYDPITSQYELEVWKYPKPLPEEEDVRKGEEMYKPPMSQIDRIRELEEQVKKLQEIIDKLMKEKGF